MSDWHQRLAAAAAPETRLARELRYRFAAPLVQAAEVWCDVGGDPAAAAAALGDELPGAVVLAGDAAATAASELPGKPTTVDADLASATDLERVRAAIAAAGDGPHVVTCLVALERLAHFGPLIELLVALAEEDGATVVLAVPEASASPEPPPEGGPVWGASAVEELRRLLPADTRLAAQVPLQGAAVVPFEGGAGEQPLTVAVDPSAQPPAAVLATFGPALATPGTVASAAAADLSVRRAWERALEADAAIAQSLLAERA